MSVYTKRLNRSGELGIGTGIPVPGATLTLTFIASPGTNLCCWNGSGLSGTQNNQKSFAIWSMLPSDTTSSGVYSSIRGSRGRTLMMQAICGTCAPMMVSNDLEAQLLPMLLPRDPLDDRNAIVELRAGTGGDEAALFAA